MTGLRDLHQAPRPRMRRPRARCRELTRRCKEHFLLLDGNSTVAIAVHLRRVTRVTVLGVATVSLQTRKTTTHTAVRGSEVVITPSNDR